MNLMYNILPIYLQLEVCISMANFHLPHGGGYFHHSDLAMQDHNYNNYDSYSSEEVVMRQRKSPRRTKYHRDFEYSDSEYNYKCKCSCTKCQKRNPKPKPCCEDFCATECIVQNNILVVPYPVPFMVFNQSAPEIPMPPAPPPSTTTTATTTTTTTTTTEPSTTLQTTPPSRKTMRETLSTAPYFEGKPYKRFQIINEKNLRRNMGNNVIHSPHKYGRLPKYGIVPIPENLALSLMQQLRKDQNNDQLRKRLSLNKNLLDYTRMPIA